MAGGAGTRLAPFTTVLPKPLIPIGGKTVIELIVDTFTDHGVSDFYLSVHYKSKIIKSYFDELDPRTRSTTSTRTSPSGRRAACATYRGRVDGDLIVTNCDVIIRADYHDLVAHHRSHDNDVTMVVSMKNFSIPYGVCEIENGGCLREIREKPQYDLLVNTGLYVIKPGVLELIPEGIPFHFTDLIAKAQETGRRVGVFPIGDDAWVDTGAWAEYRTAAAALTADRRKAPR
jgi:NDP-sugar pyrophosphorylase family protein